MDNASEKCIEVTQDIAQRAASLVEEYLRILMIPDPEGARAFVSELRIRFTGGREMHSPADCARFNSTRYAWVKKKFGRTEVVSGACWGRSRGLYDRHPLWRMAGRHAVQRQSLC